MDPKPIKNIAVYNVADQDAIPHSEVLEYSLMKYGHPTFSHRAGIHIVSTLLNNREIVENIKKHPVTYIAPSAYGVVPTASYSISRSVYRIMLSLGLNVSMLKISRADDFSTNHYGTLSAEERKIKMQARKITISEEDKARIKGNFIIALDDINVTGSHEKKLHEVFSETEASEWIFVYLVNLDNDFASSNPAYEEFLNRAAIKHATDMLPFFKINSNPDLKFRINSRALKFLLTTEPESKYDLSKADKIADLRKFYSKLDDQVLGKIYRAAISSDGYYRIEKYRDGFSLIHEEIDQRDLIKSVYARIARVLKGNVSPSFSPAI